MKNLNPPELNNIDRFKEIAISKTQTKKERLLSLIDIVFERYEEYSTKAKSVGDLSELNKRIWNSENKEVLSHCYISKTNSLDKLKKDIRESQESIKCQYCGIIPTSDTFDHYLPKSDFPEYSILPDNLIPCCPRCNTNKGDNWIENGNRQILHLYFDEIPDERYLFAELDYENGNIIVNFNLINNGNIDNDFFKIIEAHYKSLSLMKRFKKQVNEVISTIKYDIKYSEINNFQSEKVKELIKRKAKILQDKEGINSWEGAVIEKLAESDFFIESCKEDVTDN